MALRDQPYLPLYVQDFMTDERLNECSAESTGVYIRLMCVMHKSKDYGTILLKQKDKQTDKQITNFAFKLVKQLPYDAATIERALTELLEEEVLTMDGDTLYQKRMVRDGNLSDSRASAGRKGGNKKQNAKQNEEFACDFAKAKTQANTENENEIENESVNEEKSTENTEEVTPCAKKTFDHEDRAYMAAVYLDKRICQRVPSQKHADERTLQNWADAFDKCNRLDGRSWDDISRVLKFSQDDSFWQGNILSGKKFREKYLQLASQMQRRRGGNPVDTVEPMQTSRDDYIPLDDSPGDWLKG